MPTPAVRVVATDVDGTLFNSHHEIPAAAVAAAKAATAAGVPVVLCTGKMCGPWSERVVPALQLGTYAVYNNGGLIVDSEGATVYEMALEDDLVDTVLAAVEGLGGRTASVSGGRQDSRA
jgi:hydroxymethylpyrimidine pyrophosphatase-like HAD family hydrolase